MTTAIKRRRGTTAQHATFTGLEGELTVDTTKEVVVVHDGATAGGFPLVGEKGNQTIAGTKTFTNDAFISGLTVGKGGGASATNTTVGLNALLSNTSGVDNVIVGTSSGQNNTTGSQNTFVGTTSGFTNISGVYNAAFGKSALYSNTGSYNTGIGSWSMLLNSSGANNTALGHASLFSNTTASNNTAVGFQAGYSNTTGNITALGYHAGYLNTTGDQGTFIGSRAGYANTTGTVNSALGIFSLYNNSTGGFNTALGGYSLFSNTTASNNTAVGYQAGYSNQTGTYNTFVGNAAGYTSKGNHNTCLGDRAGYSLTTGVSNTFIGGGDDSAYPAGYFVTTGSKNSILGNFSGNQGGLDIRTASNYIVLSDGDGNPQATMYQGGSLALSGATPKAGTGITFPATQSASSDANTLDDYEEGTWTPAVTTNNGTATGYSNISGSYTKVGRSITVHGNITPTGGTFSGYVQLSGLPFVPATNGVGAFVNSANYIAGEFGIGAVLTNNLNVYIENLVISVGNVMSFTITYNTY